MNTALILTGHMRCWETVLPIISGYILDRFEPDVFIDTWETEGYWTGNTNEPLGFNSISPLLDVERVNKLYNPKKLVVEEFKDVEPQLEHLSQKLLSIVPQEWMRLVPRPKNVLSQTRKWYNGVNLAKEYSLEKNIEYDLVIRMRPDLIFWGDLPIISPSNFYTVKGAHTMWPTLGTGDCLQVGSMENMLKFVDINHELERLLTEHKFPCLHTASKTWIKELDLPWVEMDIHCTLQHTPYGMFRENQ